MLRIIVAGGGDLKPVVSDYEKALAGLPDADQESFAVKSSAKLEKAGDSEAIIYALQQIAAFYEAHKLPLQSIRFLKLAYQKAEKSNSRLQMGVTLRQIAIIYKNEDMLKESLTYIYQSLNLFTDRKVFTKVIIALYEASLINYKAANYADAITDFYRALEVYKKLPSDSITNDLKFYIMSGWNTTGRACQSLKRNQQGLEAYDSASKVATQIKNRFWKGLISGNKGDLLMQMGRLDEAAPLAKLDMAISREFKEYQSAAAAACLLSDIYLLKKDAARSKQYLDTAAGLFHSLPQPRGMRLRFILSASRYWGSVGNYKFAWELLLKHKLLSDSSVNEERLLSLSQVKARYELEQKESEIKFLNQTNELQKQQIENQETLIFTSAVIILLGVAFLFYARRSIKKLRSQNNIIEVQRNEIEMQNTELAAQAQLLQEQNQFVQINNLSLEEKVKERAGQLQSSNMELDTFLYHASHDIRRPIATILGLEQVARLSGVDDKTKVLFDHIAETARDMDSMLSKLHMAHQLNRVVTDMGWIALDPIIEDAAKKFEDTFQRLGIEFQHMKSNLIFCYSSPEQLMIIFSNLIENAINFRKTIDGEKSFIRISTIQSGKNVQVSLDDNGIGVEPKYLDRIFDLYFRGTAKSKGNGLGLYLVKKAADMLGITITATSVFTEGSRFMLSFSNPER